MTKAVNNNKNFIYVVANQLTAFSKEAVDMFKAAVDREVRAALAGDSRVYLMTPLRNVAEEEVLSAYRDVKNVYPVGVFCGSRKTTDRIRHFVAWAHYEPKNENAWGVKHASVVIAMGNSKANGFYAAKFAKEIGVKVTHITFEGGKPVENTTLGKTRGGFDAKALKKVSDHKVAFSKTTPSAKKAVTTKKTDRKEVKPMSDTTVKKMKLGFNLKVNESPEYYDQVIAKAKALMNKAEELKKEAKAKAKEKTKKEKEAAKLKKTATKKVSPKKAVKEDKPTSEVPKTGEVAKEAKKTVKSVKENKTASKSSIAKNTTGRVKKASETIEQSPFNVPAVVKEEVKEEEEVKTPSEVKEEVTKKEVKAKEETKETTPTGKAPEASTGASADTEVTVSERGSDEASEDEDISPLWRRTSSSNPIRSVGVPCGGGHPVPAFY